MTDEDDHALAGRLATEAGELLVELRADAFAAGAHPWQVMDEGDMRAHHFLVQALHEARPDDAILSEEGRDSSNRLTANRVWIVDPLDGTNEFGEAGRPDWAVHVALVVDGQPAAAAVALPAVGVTFRTRPAPVVPPRGDRPPRIVTSRFRSPQAAVIAAQVLGADVVRLGSAGAKAMAVVDGAGRRLRPPRRHVRVGLGRAGRGGRRGRAARQPHRRLPLVYNNPDPWLPDLLVCRPELAEPVLHALWS